MTPRVAFFSDSYYEANGVARTAGALEHYAFRRDYPFLSVHAGPATGIVERGSLLQIELARRGRTSIWLEHDLSFDVRLWRYAHRVMREVREFRPDVLHFTGPSDVGLLGAWLGYRLGIPMVGSWHTNLHEYATRRLPLRWLPSPIRRVVHRTIEQRALDLCLQFYRIPRVVLAPNQELSDTLEAGTGRLVFPMSRGVDTELFTPARRTRTDGVINIGYVGRLSPEKSVRVLAAMERALVADECQAPVRLTIVGDGNERGWLEQNLRRATFTGVLRNEALTATYADMDIFVFPSQTETVGNVVCDALASGVGVVAMAQGGPRFVAGATSAVVLDADHSAMIEAVRALVRDDARRESMRRTAREWALGRSWDAIFDNVYRAYATAVSTAVARPAHSGPAPAGRFKRAA